MAFSVLQIHLYATSFVMPTKEASQNLPLIAILLLIMPGKHQYYIYITTNPDRSVFYTGVTNDLIQRLIEHWTNRGAPKTFAGKYYCYNLIYYEEFRFINDAIAREKEIKGWRRQKKLDLVRTTNPDFTFLNTSLCDGWPPKDNDIPTRF